MFQRPPVYFPQSSNMWAKSILALPGFHIYNKLLWKARAISLTWGYIGHWVYENGVELASILKLLCRNKSLYGSRPAGYHSERLAPSWPIAAWRGEGTSSAQKMHNMVAKQEDSKMLWGKVVKGNREQVRQFTLCWDDNNWRRRKRM